MGPLGVGTWAFFWALGSKLFQGRLDYPTHLRLALRYGLLWSVVVVALPALALPRACAALLPFAEACRAA